MIAVTGLMRSGTTPLAMMLHQMGVSMGKFMCFPIHNNHPHLEWEDAVFTNVLTSQFEGDETVVVEDFLHQYIEGREQEAAGSAWGVKTPFMLPYIPQLEKVCGELGIKLTLIVTRRDYNDTLVSLHRQMDDIEQGSTIRRRLLGSQSSLEKCLATASFNADIFEFKDTKERPHIVAQRLASLVGLKIDLDVTLTGIEGVA